MPLNNWVLLMVVQIGIGSYHMMLIQLMAREIGWTHGLSFIGDGGFHLRHFVVTSIAVYDRKSYIAGLSENVIKHYDNI